MPRPKCCRQIFAMPEKIRFQPEGVKASIFVEVLLNLDEYEAIRLADLEGLYQAQAAARMNVSRQTFGRIIEVAHRKVADVLVNGKVLRIDGGSVSTSAEKAVRCSSCRQARTPECGKSSERSCPHFEENA